MALTSFTMLLFAGAAEMVAIPGAAAATRQGCRGLVRTNAPLRAARLGRLGRLCGRPVGRKVQKLSNLERGLAVADEV